MSAEYHLCIKELKKRHPEKTPTELNNIRRIIWADESLKKKWITYSKYQTYQAASKDPECLKDPGFEVPGLAPTNVLPAQPTQTTQPTKKVIHKEVAKKKDKNYYKTKCAKLKAEHTSVV